MKRILLLSGLFASIAASAAIETVELPDGAEWEAPACRLAAVRAESSVAAGTVALAGVSALEVYTNATETVTTTEVLWRRVLTNDTQSVTNDYSGQVAYTPPPPWLVASEGWVTNTSSRAVSRRVPTGETLFFTNALASVTCSGGKGLAAPTNAWLRAGDKLRWTGTASGRVTLFLER
jgi:hypothetical protein